MRTTKTLIRLRGPNKDSTQSDQSLCWDHVTRGTFLDVAGHTNLAIKASIGLLLSGLFYEAICCMSFRVSFCSCVFQSF